MDLADLYKIKITASTSAIIANYKRSPGNTQYNLM